MKTPAIFCETMTVHGILHQHPDTEAVFDRLQIHLTFEGSDCLDEVAWRRGMESQTLLELLETAIGTCACSRQEPTHANETVEAVGSNAGGVS